METGHRPPKVRTLCFRCLYLAYLLQFSGQRVKMKHVSFLMDFDGCGLPFIWCEIQTSLICRELCIQFLRHEQINWAKSILTSQIGYQMNQVTMERHVVLILGSSTRAMSGVLGCCKGFPSATHFIWCPTRVILTSISGSGSDLRSGCADQLRNNVVSILFVLRCSK